jgi:hypothetical protein
VAGLKNEYPELVSKVSKAISVPLGTSYLRELGFSSRVIVKNKQHCLSMKNELLLCVSTVEPWVYKLVEAKQAQVSH